MKKGTKIAIVLTLILAVLAAGFILAYKQLAPPVADGEKTVTIAIDHLVGEDKTLTIRTDAEYLRGALEQEGLVRGTESDYGLFITELDGEAADDAKQQWWGYTRDGAYVETGIDQTVIADGDQFEFTLNEGY